MHRDASRVCSVSSLARASENEHSGVWDMFVRQLSHVLALTQQQERARANTTCSDVPGFRRSRARAVGGSPGRARAVSTASTRPVPVRYARPSHSPMAASRRILLLLSTRTLQHIVHHVRRAARDQCVVVPPRVSPISSPMLNIRLTRVSPRPKPNPPSTSPHCRISMYEMSS